MTVRNSEFGSSANRRKPISISPSGDETKTDDLLSTKKLDASSSELQPLLGCDNLPTSRAPDCNSTRSTSVRTLFEVVNSDENSCAGDDSRAAIAAKYFFAEISGARSVSGK